MIISENGENERMNVMLSGSWILGYFLARNFYYHIQFLLHIHTYLLTYLANQVSRRDPPTFTFFDEILLR